MFKITRQSKFKFSLDIWFTLAVGALISVATALFSVALQPGAFSTSLYDIASRGITIALNFFPVAVVVALGYIISGSVFWGGSIASLIALLLSYVNLLKIEGRDDAFVPSDIGLFREAMASAASYDLDLHIPYLALLLFYCALLFTLGFFVKSAKPKIVWRVISGAIVTGLFALSMVFVYPSKDLYNSFTVPQMYNIPSVFNTLGFNYCFLYNFNLYPVEKPDGFSASQVEKWEKEYIKQKTDSKKPNVIMVMGEAFSDISNDPVFAWQNAEDNPAYLYNQLASSERAISGHMIVSNIAAGTANTEFDILTGTPTTMISDTTTSSFRVVHKNMPSLARVFADEGYKTSFLHPGNSWFYNRSSVYKYFGIEDQVFNEAFDLSKDTIAGLVTDEAFLRELKKEIESNKSPQFIYSVTIQNHQAYNYAKYYDATPDVPLNTTVSQSTMESVSVYLRGVRDSSQMIYQLAQYLDTLDEPTLLVFFGDHLPNLGSDAYNELGMPIGNTDSPENILEAYKTPFMIYGNTAYCNQNDIAAQKQALELPQNGVINNIYLGAAVLELTELNGRDGYFDFLNYARRLLPVFRDREKAYILPDGNYTNAISDKKLLDIIKKIDWWQYHRLT